MLFSSKTPDPVERILADSRSCSLPPAGRHRNRDPIRNDNSTIPHELLLQNDYFNTRCVCKVSLLHTSVIFRILFFCGKTKTPSARGKKKREGREKNRKPTKCLAKFAEILFEICWLIYAFLRLISAQSFFSVAVVAVEFYVRLFTHLKTCERVMVGFCIKDSIINLLPSQMGKKSWKKDGSVYSRSRFVGIPPVSIKRRGDRY